MLFVTLLLTAPSLPVAPPPRPARVAVTPEVAAKLRAIAFQAARDGDTDTLAAYFRAGQPAGEPNARGDTLLAVAAYHGHADAVRLVLKQPGVTVDAPNRMGLTALAAAAFKGHVGAAKELVAAKADVNAANKSGQTALMFAALSGRTEMVEYLLGAGARPDAADADGKTALALAREQGAADAARLIEAALRKKGR